MWLKFSISLLPLIVSFRTTFDVQSYTHSPLRDFKRFPQITNCGSGRSTSKLYGIPKLFRWLVDLYPIVVESVGVGSSASDCDNFYLDMNGIIHSCTHSNDDKLNTLKESEMFMRIFSYTDRLYKLVRPRKLMFLAIDGVAPRAKMNQQRSRRFRSSKEREALIADYVAKEGKMPDVESFDSNCITPGTEFMHRLGIAFIRWIRYKMDTDKFWQQNGAEVVFSGPDVPGEGEHKVMDMIRLHRSEEEQRNEYVPGKRRHCMYGLDADLIMLSLVTHEPFFVLLREKISRRKQNKDAMAYSPEDFELLEISLLRQMLKQHFRKLSGSPKDSAAANTNIISFDLERIIDDFVFMCYFIGNDFLPCLPHLDIADGSLNLMMNVYRDMLPALGGYLTDKDRIHLPRVELFLQEISRREPLYFQQRAVDEKDEAYGTEDYRQHYYKTKFGIDASDTHSIRMLVQSYLQGLCWVLTYYHKGCGSWTWYYPHLYAPLASDMVDLADLSIEFEVGRPFTPLLQLLSVLPPQSGRFLPSPYEQVMTSNSSLLAEYYPRDFLVDANGKKNSWECIVRIPFIKEEELVDAVNKIDHIKELSESERQRNIAGTEHAFKPTPTSSNGTGKLEEVEPAGRWGSAVEDQRGGSRRPFHSSASTGSGKGGRRNDRR